MISVAYHLVRPAGPGWLSRVPAMSPEALEAQLSWLNDRYRILSPDELHRAVEHGMLPDDGCVLTFDDGFIGQHRHALPILERLGLRAFFFVPTGVLDDRICPIVEKQRVLQYADGLYTDFYDRFCEALRAVAPDVPSFTYDPTPGNLAGAAGYYAEYAFYAPIERLFRQVRETRLTGPQFDRAIEMLFAAEYPDEGGVVDRYFMSWRDINDLASRGMEIGGHGHRHLIDAPVSRGVAESKVVTCLAILERRTGRPPLSYCYPYGIFIPETVAAVQAAGISVGFTCRPGEGRDGSFLLLDRMDCRSIGPA